MSKGVIGKASWAHMRENIMTMYLAHSYLLDALSPAQQEVFEAITLNKAEQTVFESSLKNLITYLHDYHQQPVVVLIDEYDSPMIEAWDKGYYRQMADFMRSWLGGGLKHVEGAAVYRSVVTGILRIAKESIFSGLNNLDVWSTLIPGPFADKFGFTEDEVQRIAGGFSPGSASWTSSGAVVQRLRLRRRDHLQSLVGDQLCQPLSRHPRDRNG